jgi:16S rRNA G966 N2-methylase RsmD
MVCIADAIIAIVCLLIIRVFEKMKYSEPLMTEGASKQQMLDRKNTGIPVNRFRLAYADSPFVKNMNSKQQEKLRKSLKFTQEMEFSISYWKYSMLVCDIVKTFIPNTELFNLTLTEGGVGAGGNTFAFANKFKLINSIEFNPTHRKYFNHNASILLSTTERKKIQLGFDKKIHDFSVAYKLTKQDVVYLDPPWGGPNYKTMNPLNMFYGNVDVCDIIDELRKKPNTLIILRAPLNYTIKFDNYYKLTTTRMIYSNIKHKKIKYKYYNFLIITNDVNTDLPKTINGYNMRYNN